LLWCAEDRQEMEAAPCLLQVDRVEHLPIAVDRELLLARVRGSRGDAKVSDDRAERRGVLLDLGQTLMGERAFVSARDRVVVGIAEQEAAELVHEPVLELRLGEPTGRGAWRRRRSCRWVRRDRSRDDRRGDG